MKLFSLWCAWKEDTKTTLNTATSSPLVLRGAAAGDKSQTTASTDLLVWKLADFESSNFATWPNIKGLFFTTAFNPSSSIILQGCTQTVCKLYYLLSHRHTEHSPPCTSLHTHKFTHALEHEESKKYGLNVTLSYCSCKPKFLSKSCPLTVNLA